MGLFGKKKKKEDEKGVEKVSQLPELPPPNTEFAMPPEPDRLNEIPSQPGTTLPQFPDSGIGQEMNQNAIKDAVGTIPIAPFQKPKTQEIPDIPQERNPKTMEMAGTGIMGPELVEGSDIAPEIKRPAQTAPGKEPLFVKLDEFEKAISSFDEIKLRVSEIEDVLRKIKDVNTKEEREIDNWEREIKTVKTRLSEIDRELFSRI